VKQCNADYGLAEGATSVEQAGLVALRRRPPLPEPEVEILRRATAIFAKNAASKIASPVVPTLPSTGFP
jgi:hypothetical protein